MLSNDAAKEQAAAANAPLVFYGVEFFSFFSDVDFHRTIVLCMFPRAILRDESGLEGDILDAQRWLSDA